MARSFRRHTADCTAGRPRHERTYESDERKRGYAKCSCPIHFEGVLDGSGFTRKGTGAITWDVGNRVVARWERDGNADATLAMVEADAPSASNPADSSTVTIQHACEAFLNDAAARNLDLSTTYAKYKTLTKQMQTYADDKGIRFLSQFGPRACFEFRASWKDGKRSGGKKLERLKAFFKFCVAQGWLEENPAEALKPPVGAGDPAGVYPFTDAEMKNIYAACLRIPFRAWKNGQAEGRMDGERLKTFIMVMVRTGLAITDTAFLSTDKVTGNDVEIRRTKTGAKVTTWIPDALRERLESLTLRDGKYYFLLGDSRRKQTPGNVWRDHINRAFDLVAAPREEGGLGHPWKHEPTPHRFRHTFARIMLQARVSVPTVAALMGDTEEMVLKHYAQWVTERQDAARSELERAFRDYSGD